MRFFPKAKPESAYRKIHQLAKSGYVEPIVSSSGNGFVWALGDRGFKEILEDVGPLAENGYKSEAVGHDLLTMAAMMGEWISGPPSGIQVFTEQQLRRLKVSQYPMWVPHSDNHRADGYMKLPGLKLNGTVAFEIERSQKELSKYELIADFYEEFPFVSHVVWFTPLKNGKCSIDERIRSYLKRTNSKHSFVDLNDFTKLGWQAKFAIGPLIGKSVSEFMVNSSSTPRQQVDSRLLLETKKCPRILDPSKITETHTFFN